LPATAKEGRGEKGGKRKLLATKAFLLFRLYRKQATEQGEGKKRMKKKKERGGRDEGYFLGHTKVRGTRREKKREKG